MKPSISDLWRWDDTVDRGPYVLIGVVLFALKHNIDRFVASFVFNQKWSLFNYISPSDVVITDVNESKSKFYATLLIIAIPFIYTGVALTLRRLRAVGLPLWLIALFFAPLLNLVFFIVLGILPSQKDVEMRMWKGGRLQAFFDRLIPETNWGSATMAFAITVPLFALLTVTSVNVFGEYGWSLFVGFPFMLGFISVLIYSHHQKRSFASCMAVSVSSVIVLGLALFGLAIEGVICIAMAAPIGIFLAMVGGTFGYVIQVRPWTETQSAKLIFVLFLISPLLMGAEYTNPPTTSLIAVKTSIVIDAAPEKVWNNVVSFSELPPPKNWLFDLGIAYPMRAEVKGMGVGAIRHCVFSTGAFVEPIEVWDEPKLLKFSVTSQPPAMKELSFYDITPAHTNHYLVSEGGQFLLTRLPDGKTQLEGTTWYRHKIWPATYWQVWSDTIIHNIHLRVLQHIKTLSEDQK